MIGVAESKNGVPIRLTEERWYHIIEHHEDLAGYAHEILDTIENPDLIVEGWLDELLAIREWRRSRHLIVVYKETSKTDGFVITAYSTKRMTSLRRRKVIWQKPSQST
ncbi:MAG: PBECR2 nuclease fold domain-containing protein [Candidatus Bipolaricaulota bacterium]|nr:PBECR2 nuclease fold domain-containing protein [Candidatus Bipolaricaulota bacterium]